MRKMLFATVGVTALAAAAFSSEICDVVVIDSPSGPTRVNKSDYDADQADGGAKRMTALSDEDQVKYGGVARGYTLATAQLPDNISVPPAPAAPTPAPAETPAAETINPQPATVQPEQLLVQKPAKEGGKFHIVRQDGKGGFEPVKDLAGIDAKGYASDVDAWAAIVEAQRLAQLAGKAV